MDKTDKTAKKTWAECTPFERTWLLGELERVRFDYLDRKITSDWAERAAVIEAAHDALASSTAMPEVTKEADLPPEDGICAYCHKEPAVRGGACDGCSDKVA